MLQTSRAPSVFQTLLETLSMTDDPRTRGCSQMKLLVLIYFEKPTVFANLLPWLMKSLIVIHDHLCTESHID